MISIIVVRDGLVDENILCKNIEEAKVVFKKFDDILDEKHSNIDEIFEAGFVSVNGGSICISIPEIEGSVQDLLSASEESQGTELSE